MAKSSSSSSKGTSKVGSSGYKSPALAQRAAQSAATYKGGTIIRSGTSGGAGASSLTVGSKTYVSQALADRARESARQMQAILDNPNASATDKNYARTTLARQGVVEGGTGVVDESGKVQEPAQQTAEQLRQQRIQSALDYIKDSGLPQEWKDIFSDSVKNWNADTEINIPNIIENFKKIESEKIDPHYKGLVGFAIADLQNEYNRIEAQKTDAQKQYDIAETERKQQQQLTEDDAKMTAEANIRGTKADLEARGLTFSGESRRQLGGESAFAQGDPNAFQGLAIPFGGTDVIEGLIPQANTLVRTSLDARRKAAEEDYARAIAALNQQFSTGIQGLGLTAEAKLGSSGVPSFLSSYYKPAGGITGDIESQKRTDLGNVATGLISQAQGNSNTSVNLPSYFSY